MCGPLPKTLTIFMTKICDFPYPIYDLVVSGQLQFKTPGVQHVTGADDKLLRHVHSCRHVKEVASSKKTEFKTRVQKLIPYLLQNGGKMAKIDTRF